MDESFLSQQDVVEASRRFTCIRLATYENSEEAKVLKSIFTGRSGELENTVFALLSTDGKRLLSRPGRSPSFAYRDHRQMAAAMHQVADQLGVAKKPSSTQLALPKMADCRLGLNVAACDHRPLVLVVGKSAETRARLERLLAPMAWSDDFQGRFVYATARDAAELKPMGFAEADEGVWIVEPGQFGQRGQMLARVKPDADAASIKDALNLAVLLHIPHGKSHSRQVTEGRRQGVEWKTAIPVTDPGRRGSPPRRP